MQKIELTPRVTLGRCVQDVSECLLAAKTSEEVIMAFEQAIEQGFDTFLVPIVETVLVLLDDVFLQRPYLRDRIQLMCQLTPRVAANEAITDSSVQAIREQVQLLATHLEQPQVTLGLFSGQDPLLDPVALTQIWHDLRMEEAILEFGVCEMDPEVLTLCQRYVEADSSPQIWLSDWHSDFFGDVQTCAALAAQQVFPLLRYSSDERLMNHPQMLALSEKYCASPEAVAMAWILYHPLHVMLLFEKAEASRLQRIYKEAVQFEFMRKDWYLLI